MAGISIKQQEKRDDFINQLVQGKNQDQSKDDPLSFQNIQKLSLEELKTKIDPELQDQAKNLKLATLFSSDPIMQMVLFNTVQTGSYENNVNLLSNMFTHRNIYLDNQNDSIQMGAFLRKSIIEQIDDPDIKAQQEQLEKEFNYTMMKFEMSEYFNTILDFGKTEKENNKDTQFGFLYNDFYTQYAMLNAQYDEVKDFSDLMIAQYKSNSIPFL